MRLFGFSLVLASAALTFPAMAAATASFSGQYLCQSGCRLTDAPPSIAIDGHIAHCTNELGGIYTGLLLSPQTIYCFNKSGTLSKDGMQILWSNGAIWRRR